MDNGEYPVNRRPVKVVGEQESCNLLIGKVALVFEWRRWVPKAAELSKRSRL